MSFVGMQKSHWQTSGWKQVESNDVSGVSQVRCAAVFALGTFVGNSAERTDHSTTIDHNVAMMLAQLINDGSPMVRKVRRGAGAGWVPTGELHSSPQQSIIY